jgi:hypothetical protein
MFCNVARKYFWAFSQNCEKQLLASSRPPGRQHGTFMIPMDEFL